MTSSDVEKHFVCEGWGPSTKSAASSLSNLESIYSSFGKDEPLGKIADWSSKYINKQNVGGNSGGGLVGYVHEEDISSFSLVGRSEVANRSTRFRRTWTVRQQQQQQKQGGRFNKGRVKKTLNKRGAVETQ